MATARGQTRAGWPTHHKKALAIQATTSEMGQSLQAEKAQIGQVQPSSGEFVFVERTAGLGVSSIGESCSIQLSCQPIPTHKEFHDGGIDVLAFAPPAPNGFQRCRQDHLRALFHKHGAKSTQERHLDHFRLHLHLCQALEDLIQKASRLLSKALAEPRCADLYLPTPHTLDQSFHSFIGPLHPSQDERLCEIGARECSFSLKKTGFSREADSLFFQNALSCLGLL